MVRCHIGLQPDRFAFVTYDQTVCGFVFLGDRRTFIACLDTADSDAAKSATTNGAKVDGIFGAHFEQTPVKVVVGRQKSKSRKIKEEKP